MTTFALTLQSNNEECKELLIKIGVSLYVASVARYTKLVPSDFTNLFFTSS